MKINTLTLFIILFGFEANLFAQNYLPPAGIPAPSFGIEEQAPPWPSSWPSAEVVNYYYIDSTHINATNSNNPYGYPDKPRATIPEITYAAGAYVEIHGGPYNGGGQIIFTGHGTLENPIWIRGQSHADRGEINGEMIVKGSYIIIENLTFSTDNATIGIRPHNGSTANYISVRNNEMYGSGTDVGFTSAIGISGTVGNRNHDIVIYNNQIYDRGDYRPTAVENDYHGVSPNRNVDRVWILNNEIYHMGGDSVQVGVASIPDIERPSYVYLADNNFYSNFENALDIKEANHVFAINNDFHDFADAAVVIHNMGDYIWIINNHVYTTPVGIVTSGSTNTWFIGNVIWNIHTRDLSTWNPESGYSDGTAIHFRAAAGGAINNTIYNYDNGIQLTTAGPYASANNILFGRHQVTGYDLRIANSDVRNITNSDYNIYEDPNIDFATGSASSIADIQNNFSQELSSFVANPMVVNTTTSDYRLQLGSPAIDTGGDIDIYQSFFNQYGLDISVDGDSISRPVGGAWDIGAYEYYAENSAVNIFSDGFE
jgi:hypothetical protein